jgi:hypothetical protein
VNTGTAVVVSVVVLAGAALAYVAFIRKPEPVHYASPAPSPVQQAAGGAQQAIQGIGAVLQAAPKLIDLGKNIFGSIFG